MYSMQCCVCPFLAGVGMDHSRIDGDGHSEKKRGIYASTIM